MLSNLYPHVIEIDNQTFPSTEHYYQYNKCLSNGDTEAAASVLLSNQPEDAMAAGRSVRQTPEWTLNEGRAIMKKALKSKFSCGSMSKKLKSTGNRLLAEATRHPCWGIGQPFTSHNVLSPDTHRGHSLLGKLLMEIRSEL